MLNLRLIPQHNNYKKNAVQIPKDFFYKVKTVRAFTASKHNTAEVPYQL
jgi:hypothetical protein